MRPTVAAPTHAPPPRVVHKPKPTFHFDPPRVRLTDLGVASRAKLPPIRRTADTTADPHSSVLTTKRLVLIVAGLAGLLAIAAISVFAVRRRRLAAGWPSDVTVEQERYSSATEYRRVWGDRMRVAFDERGADVLLIGVGLATAVVLGAVIAG